jgi:rhodanese-related sulfurtransferase
MEKKKNRRRAKPEGKKQLFPTWAWAALAAVALLVVAVMVLTRPEQAGKRPELAESQAQAEALPLEVSVSEAAQMRTDGAFILDVREPLEYDEFHIPEAHLIPLQQLQSRLDEVPRDQEVLVVCRSGNRSATGRDILLQAGFTQVTSMAGGMLDWQNQGFATISAK